MTTTVLGNDTGLDLSAATVEASYCYDGFDAECGGVNSADARGTTGRLSRVSDKVSSVEMGYDSLGRETTESRAATGGSLVTTTAYDDNGNPTSVLYRVGQPVRVDDVHV